MTTIAKLASHVSEQSEQYRRLMSPVIAQIAQQVDMQKKLMAPFVEVMRKHAEIQKKLTDSIVEPIRRQEELRRAVLSSVGADFSRIEEARRKLITPIITAIASQQQAHKRLMAPFIQAMGRQEELRRQLILPVVEQAARHAQIHKAIVAQFAQQTALHQSLLEPSSSFMRQLESLRSLKLDLLNESLRTLPQGAPEAVAEEDVSAVEAVVSNPEFRELSLVEQINRLIEAVRELKSGTARTIALTIATTLITLVLTDCYTKVKEHFFGPEQPKVIVREIQTIVKNSGMIPDTIREYRIVSHHSVAIRQSRRRNSQRIGVLTAGDIVHLMNKQGPWCLIEWHDETVSNVVRGWIRSKYLKRMAK